MLRALIFVSIYIKIYAVPPDACFENFRWEDCGREPVRVLYYWKPGSRCEVGVWRGCLPNMNMFNNEYECVSTCIFTARAQPKDYHILNEEDKTDNILDGEKATETTTTLPANQTVTGSIDVLNGTGTVLSGNLTTGGTDGNSTGTEEQTVTAKLLRQFSSDSEEDLFTPYKHRKDSKSTSSTGYQRLNRVFK